MDGNAKANLIEAIGRWRAKNLQSYWIRVDYIGSALNRMGDHELTFSDGQLWHRWHDDWRKIEAGSDFWLFSVPGSFAWARDVVDKVLPVSDAPDSALELEFDGTYGYVKRLKVQMSQRDPSNFTFEIKAFGEGPHAEFNK